MAILPEEKGGGPSGPSSGGVGGSLDQSDKSSGDLIADTRKTFSFGGLTVNKGAPVWFYAVAALLGFVYVLRKR